MKTFTKLLGALIMIDTAMFAGCTTSSGASKISDTQKEEKILRNDDGIAVYCPAKYTAKNPDTDYGFTVHQLYYSTVCEKNKFISVTLPAGYTEEKKYPVLYVLHGYWGTEQSMTGCSTTIGNMIADKKAEEMIIVYPFIYSSKTKMQCTSFSDPADWEAYDNFVNEIKTDIMPWVKENFSVKEGRENTAITGFSMGGREALACGIAHPDLFGYVGAMAPAPGLTPNTMHPGQYPESEAKFPEGKEPVLLL